MGFAGSPLPRRCAGVPDSASGGVTLLLQCDKPPKQQQVFLQARHYRQKRASYSPLPACAGSALGSAAMWPPVFTQHVLAAHICLSLHHHPHTVPCCWGPLQVCFRWKDADGSSIMRLVTRRLATTQVWDAAPRAPLRLPVCPWPGSKGVQRAGAVLKLLGSLSKGAHDSSSA